MAVIRTTTEDDIPRILELYKELVITTSEVEQNRNPSLEDYRSVYAQIRAMPGHELLIAEEEG